MSDGAEEDRASEDTPLPVITLPVPAAGARVVEMVQAGLILMVAALALALVWLLRDALLLAFAAVLLAILLSAAAALLQRGLPISRLAALAVVLVLLALLGAGFGTQLGTQTMAQVDELSNRLPEALRTVEEYIDLGRLEDWIADRLDQTMAPDSVVVGISGITTMILGAVGGLALILSGGIFLSIEPKLYRSAVLILFPINIRSETQGAMLAVAAALRQWLVGQLVAMVAVGLLTGVGLFLLGVPTAFALGVTAGLLEFVPYLGPIASAAPALAVAFADRPVSALWVGLLYFAVQQIEGVVLLPVIQKRAVDLPPAITLFSVVIFGLLFGVMGVILAAPLTVVVVTLVRTLWLPRADALGRGGGEET